MHVCSVFKINCLYTIQIDLTFVQSLRGIRDIDKSGVTEDIFSEVHQVYH